MSCGENHVEEGPRCREAAQAARDKRGEASGGRRLGPGSRTLHSRSQMPGSPPSSLLRAIMALVES